MLLMLIIVGFSQIYYAQENRNIDFSFEGNKIFSGQELLEAYNKCPAKYQENPPEQFDRIINYCLQKYVKNYISSKGYITARIGDIKKEQTENLLKIVIPVEEGNQFRLGEVEIKGAETFSNETIRGMLSLKTGDIANSGLLQNWIYESLKNIYEQRGFMQFDAEIEPVFKNDLVNIQLTIYEGQIFKIRRIIFKTDTKLKNDYLKKYLNISEGEILNKAKFVKGIENLNKLDKFEWIDSDKDIEMLADNEIPLIDLIINIKKKK